MYNAILYSTFVVFFTILYFLILKAIKIERFFEQGHIKEIRLAYVLFSFMFGALTALGLYKIVEVIQSAI